MIKNKIKDVPGLLFVTDSLEFMSTAGRRRMLDQPWLTALPDLDKEQENVQVMKDAMGDQENNKPVNVLRHQLMQLHDIKGTLQSLSTHVVLDEVELFEIKNLAYLCNISRQSLADMQLTDHFPLPDIQEVFHLLDPDGTGVPNFYIYDSYDERLAPVRRKMKSANEEEMSSLLAQQNEIQQQVIVRLCNCLHPYCDALMDALEGMAYIDFTMARAVLAQSWGLVVPSRDGATHDFQGLFNPRLKQHNESVGLRYQPVDITLTPGVTFITGANMAGKTVLLKSVGLAQLMYQFGFPIPATSCCVAPVDDVVFCIGDDQNEMNGLSSFASEITRISDVVYRSQKERLLILIDEPARTTNPVEGKALVQALASIMQTRDSITFITTHYSQLGLQCRRLRVKGFVEDLVDIPLTAQNINRFIDYSLVPDNSDEVPQEALRIAEMLSCNAELIASARRFMVR
jgi:DNA mismatch repair ATPase MutS